MSTHIHLSDLTDKALALLKAQGLSASTLGGYAKKYEFLKKHFASLGSAYYDESLLSRFMVDYEEKHKNGTICYFYLRQWQRATRLIKEIAAEGTADLNPYVNRRKYVVSKENEAVINSILDSYNLQGIPREEMDISLRHICSYACGENDSLLNITDDHLLKFIGTEIPNSTSGSKSRTMRAVKLLSEYFRKNQINAHNLDFTYVHLKDRSDTLIEPFTAEEITKMLNAIDTSDSVGLRDYAIILLAFDTGLRAVDIRTLQFSDIDWKNAIIKVNQDKTNEPLTLPLTNRVMNAISDYILKGRPESDSQYIFLISKAPYRPFNRRHGTFTGLIRKYCDAAGVEHIYKRGFHSLRRSFATELSLSGAPIEVISQMLGHKSILEDKPYLSYNKNEVSFCAFDFTEIPISSGIYAAHFKAE